MWTCNVLIGLSGDSFSYFSAFFFLVDLPCFLFYLSFIFPLSDAYSFNFFPSSKHAGFVQAAFAFGEARTLSHSLLPSFREDFQAWAFSRLPFPHCCCLSLGGLLDVGCSAGNILFPPSSHVVSIGWVCFSRLSPAFLLQVSQEAQGWNGLLGESERRPEWVVHVVWKKQATSFSVLFCFSLCNSGPGPICCYMNWCLKRLLMSDYRYHLDGTASYSRLPAWLILDKVLATIS